LQRLRSAIAAGHIDTVVVVKLDRFTRSVTDFAELMEFFKQHDVDFISLRETMDTSMAMGRGMLAIVMAFAQLERETTGERTRATMEDRVERGLWNGGLVYGYSVDPDGKAPYRTGRFRTICAPLKRGERSLALARERRESAVL
jgi:DNA invertase Pin-like site-specific DNA recombinase